MGSLPCLHVSLIVWTTALGAGSMPRSKGRSLVAEEQLSVVTGRIDHRLTPLEGQSAGNPGLMSPTDWPEPPLVIMEDTSVPHA
jgi:hypothetical protein